MTTYIGTDWHNVYADGKPLDAAPSFKLRGHSPTGFSWGYGGSGPAQLALAILMLEKGDEYALANYMRFKWDVIARFRHAGGATPGFRLTSEEIGAWCDGKELAVGAIVGTLTPDAEGQ